MKLFQFVLASSLASFAYGGGFQPFPGSVISSQSERVDVFFTDEATGEILHKYHANPAAGWNNGFEQMNINVSEGLYPAAVSLGNQLHVFANQAGYLVHRFFDGTQWLPATSEPEQLAYGLAKDSNLAVTARGSKILHIVGRGDAGNLVHKYYDGTTWKPDGNKDFEDLGSDGLKEDVQFGAAPAINSWGPDRLDIFGTLVNGTLLHKYWDGSQWNPSVTGWEQWGDNFLGEIQVTSWGKDRLDVWGVALKEDPLRHAFVHRFWDGHSLSNWEEHKGLVSPNPSITHWSSNRIDIVSLSTDSNKFIYKYWDGGQWNPSPDSSDWLNHGPADFEAFTEPAIIAWGQNTLNLFAFDKDQNLKWQLWEGSQWLPSFDRFYDLGHPSSAAKDAHRKPKGTTTTTTGKQVQGDKGLHVQDPASLDL